MKKYIITIILITVTTFANAQFAVFAGLNNSDLKFSPNIEGYKSKQGLNAGVQLNTPVFLNKYSLMAELGFSEMGSKFENTSGYGTNNSSINLDYINLYILGKYSIIGSGFLSAFAGPQIGYLMNAKNKYEYTDYFSGENISGNDDVKDDFKKIDFSMIFGAEVAIPVGYPVYASARYQLGLTNIIEQNSSESITSKNNNFSIGVSYRFE
jgi:hypothetical protein